MNEAPVITLDGPSATGKGTVAGLVAQRLGFHRLDSGALYRALALAARQRGIDLEDGAALAALSARLAARFEANGQTWLDGEDASLAIRTPEAGQWASRIATLAEVREALLPRQRAFRCAPGLVAEGRDMGTVVFPDAECKIFLDASAAVRAERRWRQLLEKGLDARLPDLLQDLQSRDSRDMQRGIAPLRPARQAIRIDTSHLPVESVVEKVLERAMQVIDVGLGNSACD